MELDERREADGPSDFVKTDAFVGRILMSGIAILNDRHMLNLWRYRGIILNIADISLLLMNTAFKTTVSLQACQDCYRQY